MRPLGLSVPSSAFVFLTVLTAAFAVWGGNGGEMVWGVPVSVPSVPAVGLFVLAFALLSTAARRSPARAKVAVPNTLNNGSVADAHLR